MDKIKKWLIKAGAYVIIGIGVESVGTIVYHVFIDGDWLDD